MQIFLSLPEKSEIYLHISKKSCTLQQQKFHSLNQQLLAEVFQE